MIFSDTCYPLLEKNSLNDECGNKKESQQPVAPSASPPPSLPTLFPSSAFPSLPRDGVGAFFVFGFSIFYVLVGFGLGYRQFTRFHTAGLDG